LKIDPLMRQALSLSDISTLACGIAYKSRYYLAVPTLGANANTRLLELYLDMPPDQEAQHPWMAHDIASVAFAVVPSTSDDLLVSADANAPQKVRRLFFDSSDVAPDDTTGPITATAATGGLTFDTPAAKRMKRIEVRGQGNVTISVSGDFDNSSGEPGIFQMPISTGSKWLEFNWGEAEWGGADGGSQIARARYTRKARFFTLNIKASGTEAGASASYLGLSSFVQGGAAVHSMELTVTPLDTW
jgi:hypothetical protein